MAVAALLFVACNENGPSSADKKCANVVSSEAIKLLGQDMTAVDKALTDAGYIKVDAQTAAAAPKCVRALLTKAAERTSQIYVYGLPANINQMTDAEYDACVQKTLQEGKTIAQAYIVVDENGKMMGMQTAMYIKLSENVNQLFIDVSNKLYAQIPAGAIPSEPMTEMPTSFPFAIWQGDISLATTSEKDQDYLETTDHAAYIAKISANKSLEAAEFGALYKDQQYNGWGYQTMWLNPGEEEQQTMIKEIGVAVAYGMFMVADNNAGGQQID